MLVSQSEEQSVLRRIFEKLDTEHEGTLKLVTFQNSMTEVVEFLTMQPEQVEEIFKAIDKDNLGKINWPQFLQAAMDSKELLKSENLSKAFNSLAYPEDCLTPQKLKEAFGSSPAYSNKYQDNDNIWAQIIQEIANDDQSEGVNYEDFERYMQSAKEKRERFTKAGQAVVGV